MHIFTSSCFFIRCYTSMTKIYSESFICELYGFMLKINWLVHTAMFIMSDMVIREQKHASFSEKCSSLWGSEYLIIMHLTFSKSILHSPDDPATQQHVILTTIPCCQVILIGVVTAMYLSVIMKLSHSNSKKKDLQSNIA